MLCFEILINGSSVCIAGNSNDRRLSVDVYRGRNEPEPNIFVAGDSYVENEWSERYIWGNQRLKLRDEILIKVVHADQPDLPIETHKINANQENERLTDLIVKQTASLWLDHLLRGDPVPLSSQGDDRSPKTERIDERNCTFCGKNQHEVKKLIASPGKEFICNECVNICVEILQEPDAKPSEVASEPEPIARWPKRDFSET
jgi:hypothetical protein